MSVDEVNDALETAHDVPSARACGACHGGRRSFVLGFSALQLSHAARDQADTNLERAIAAGWLTQPSVAAFKVPGDATTQAALGYLHANCAQCHNGARPADAKYMRPPDGLDLELVVADLSSPEATPTYRSAIPQYVVPGRPEDSSLLTRTLGRSFLGMRRRMPPLATSRLDTTGRDALSHWIAALQTR